MKYALIGVLILACAIAAMAFRRKTTGQGGELPVFAERPLLTAPEQILYLRLIDALPNYIVFAQVQLCRLFDIERGPQQQTWFNKTSQKSVDYVVCTKDFKTIAVIELDEKSHDAANRKKADADKDTALNAAGIKVIRWTVKNMPDRFEIARQLNPSP